jgi:methyl-accepting chemotaxis protein
MAVFFDHQDARTPRAGESPVLDIAADTARDLLLDALRQTWPFPTQAKALSQEGGCAARPVLGRLERIAEIEPPAHLADAGGPVAIGTPPLTRLTMALRSRPEMERRHTARFPHCVASELWFGQTRHRTETLNIGHRGLMVFRPPDCKVKVGAFGRIALSGVGELDIRVVGAEAEYLNLNAQGKVPASVAAAFDGLLLRLRGENDFHAGQVRNLAATIANRFETALNAGEIDFASLFDRDYAPIPGTMPPQFTTTALPFYRQVLPGILARFFEPRSGCVYAVATDRGGYVPVHNPPFSQKQRPGDAAFNLAYCRDRRIYDDVTTLQSARFSRDATIQTYARDIGQGPDVIVKDASAPIIVKGQRWGCAQIAFLLRQA